MDVNSAIKSMSPEQILACVDICDGHTLFKPEVFIEAGFPEEAIPDIVEVYKSDGTPKGSLYDETNKPVDEIKAIYDLDFLRQVAGILDVKYPDMMGRGFQARVIKQSIKAHLFPEAVPLEVK